MQTVLEWQPFELMVTQDTTPIPGAVLLVQIDLSPVPDDGTRLVLTFSKAKGPLLRRVICNAGARVLAARAARKGMTALGRQIERDLKDGTVVLPETTDVPRWEIADAAAQSLKPSG